MNYYYVSNAGRLKKRNIDLLYYTTRQGQQELGGGPAVAEQQRRIDKMLLLLSITPKYLLSLLLPE